jgi:hypothetical protein
MEARGSAAKADATLIIPRAKKETPTSNREIPPGRNSKRRL